MASARSVVTRRFLETVGWAKASEDREIDDCASGIGRMERLHKVVDNLRSSLEAANNYLNRGATGERIAQLEGKASAPLLSTMVSHIEQLREDAPEESQRAIDTFKEVHDGVDGTLAQKMYERFHRIVVGHCEQWLVELHSVSVAQSQYKEARVVRDHYWDKLAGLTHASEQTRAAGNAESNSQVSRRMRNQSKLDRAEELYQQRRDELMKLAGQVWEQRSERIAILLRRMMQFERTRYNECYKATEQYEDHLQALKESLRSLGISPHSSVEEAPGTTPPSSPKGSAPPGDFFAPTDATDTGPAGDATPTAAEPSEAGASRPRRGTFLSRFNPFRGGGGGGGGGESPAATPGADANPDADPEPAVAKDQQPSPAASPSPSGSAWAKGGGSPTTAGGGIPRNGGSGRGGSAPKQSGRPHGHKGGQQRLFGSMDSDDAFNPFSGEHEVQAEKESEGGQQPDDDPPWDSNDPFVFNGRDEDPSSAIAQGREDPFNVPLNGFSRGRTTGKQSQNHAPPPAGPRHPVGEAAENTDWMEDLFTDTPPSMTAAGGAGMPSTRPADRSHGRAGSAAPLPRPVATTHVPPKSGPHRGLHPPPGAGDAAARRRNAPHAASGSLVSTSQPSPVSPWPEDNVDFDPFGEDVSSPSQSLGQGQRRPPVQEPPASASAPAPPVEDEFDPFAGL